jgi:hypothetical protein
MSKKSNVLDMTPEEAQAFLRRVMGPPKRRIEGEEYKHLMLILNLKTPISSSNNQRFWTDEYEHNSRIYEVTYGIEEDPYLEEVGP